MGVEEVTIGKYPKTATLPSWEKKGTVGRVEQELTGALPSLSEGAVPAQEWDHSSFFHGAGIDFLSLSFRNSSVPAEHQHCCHQMCPVPKPPQPVVPRTFPGTSQPWGKVENEEKGRSPTTKQPCPGHSPEKR